MALTAATMPGAGPDATAAAGNAATQRASWRRLGGLSSGLGRIEQFLAEATFERAPWLAVGFGCGIAAWFMLDLRWQWMAFAGTGLAMGIGLLRKLKPHGRYPYTRSAVAALALALAAGCMVAWERSALVGQPALHRPWIGTIRGIVIARTSLAAEDRTRLLVATRDPFDPARPIRVRINLAASPAPALRPGAVVRVRVRLLPPAQPLLPGSYDFARTAWFAGLAATGSALEPVTIESAAPDGHMSGFAAVRQALADHIVARLPGSPGGIAAALASGDRGGIAAQDETALRDAGLSHLLSVSGLHVSALIGATYWLAMRLLALWPWLALRVRLPLLASTVAALAGLGYTLLTGAEVPTVRSMAGALLILVAVALGREPLSLRMLATAAFVVMLFWPEAVMGPSFQLSFGAVLAIVALHGSPWIRRISAPDDAPIWARVLRQGALLVLTGVVIELAILPIGLVHFHRAGVYGALANVVAIPLTTFVIMPLIVLALVLDLLGAGTPAWWLAGHALDLLIALARFAAAQPGSILLLPPMGNLAYALMLGGGLWLALWQRRLRWAGLLPICLGTTLMATARVPDLLVARDGRQVGIAGVIPGQLVLLRHGEGRFTRDAFNELAAYSRSPQPIEAAPGVRCNREFCLIAVRRRGRTWQMLLSRGTDLAPWRDLAATCERVDVVIAPRRLPHACRPRWLKIDRALLDRTGGLALDLGRQTLIRARPDRDDHGWTGPAYSRADTSPRPIHQQSATPGSVSRPAVTGQ